MKKQRQKQIGIDAVVKVQNFLQTVKDKIDNGELFSLINIASLMKIDRMIATMAFRNGYFYKGVVKGEYVVGANWAATDTAAKKLIELVRLSKIESSTEKIKADMVRSTTDQTNIEPAVALFRKGGSLEKTQSKQAGLFDAKEKEFDDKLKIACAIASGVYQQYNPNNDDLYIQAASEYICIATKDLYDKLKKQ